MAATKRKEEWILKDGHDAALTLYYTGYCSTAAADLAFRFSSREDAVALAAHLARHAPSLGVFEVISTS